MSETYVSVRLLFLVVVLLIGSLFVITAVNKKNSQDMPSVVVPPYDDMPKDHEKSILINNNQ